MVIGLVTEVWKVSGNSEEIFPDSIFGGAQLRSASRTGTDVRHLVSRPAGEPRSGAVFRGSQIDLPGTDSAAHHADRHADRLVEPGRPLVELGVGGDFLVRFLEEVERASPA